jgi:hypothetical protein
MKKNIKISIDYDGTLSRKDVQGYAKDLVKRGFDVHIVTSRHSDKAAKEKGWWWILDQNKNLFNVAEDCGIKLENIHFTCMESKSIFLKDKGKEKGIHIFDSYGNTPDCKEWKQGINAKLLEELGQEKPYLLEQLYDSGFDMYYNEYQFQDLSKNVSSCGRHCCCRSYFTDLDTDEYYNMINRIIDDVPFINNPDEVVLTLTTK